MLNPLPKRENCCKREYAMFEKFAQWIGMTSLSITSGGSFIAWFDFDEMFADHAVTVYGSLKRGIRTADIEG